MPCSGLLAHPAITHLWTTAEYGRPVQPWNTFVEGDNLDVLPTVVAEFGEVDLVYIDPPYNTGNDFAYADDIRGQDGLSRHEAWVAMMRPAWSRRAR